MAMLFIPTRIDQSNYAQTVSLSGVDYDLTLRWNQRDGRWYMDLASQGATIMASKRVVANWPLIYPNLDPPWPPGMLMAVDMADPTGGVDPGLSDLGDRVLLIYFYDMV